MALGPVFPGLSMSLFFWLVVARRDNLFGLNIGKIGARAWRRVSNFGQGQRKGRMGKGGEIWAERENVGGWDWMRSQEWEEEKGLGAEEVKFEKGWGGKLVAAPMRSPKKPRGNPREGP